MRQEETVETKEMFISDVIPEPFTCIELGEPGKCVDEVERVV